MGRGNPHRSPARSAAMAGLVVLTGLLNPGCTTLQTRETGYRQRKVALEPRPRPPAATLADAGPVDAGVP